LFSRRRRARRREVTGRAEGRTSRLADVVGHGLAAGGIKRPPALHRLYCCGAICTSDIGSPYSSDDAPVITPPPESEKSSFSTVWLSKI